MITTVTLNPCIDKTIEINNLVLGETNQVLKMRENIGGKGINVSVILQRMGIENKATGFIYREGERSVLQYLQKEGCGTCFTDVEGRIRTNMKIFERETRRMSEFNTKGEQVSLRDLDRFLQNLEQNLEDTSILVLNGSVPPGVPDDIYERIIEKANKKNVRVVLDASGELLKKGIQAKPELIKPNLQELESIFRKKFITLGQIVETGRKLVEEGVKYVCISLGSKGAVFMTAEHVFFAEPLNIEVKGVQGAGDSMVAGFCYGMEHNWTDEEIFRYGVACAAASLTYPGTELCRKRDTEEMLPLVCVKDMREGR